MHRTRLTFSRALALVIGGGILTLAVGLSTSSDVARAAAADVVISEIMYNPENDRDSDEFLELHNTGADAVDLSDWCVDGASFCFPVGSSIGADEYLVISPDAARLQSVYGVTSGGVYDGGLKNGGEELQLIDAAGTVIHQFEYDDGGEWATLPDGEGPSLELIAPDARSSAWGWAASSAGAGHTAGGPNSTSVAGQPPSITGVLASTPAPVDGEAITIAANIANATAPPRLNWRTNLGTYSTIEMTGTAPNFSATIPGQSAGELLEYQIEADGVYDHRWPRFDDSTATLGIHYARSITTDIAVFEWFISDADYDAMVTDHLFDDRLFESVLVVGDEVITGAKVRVRGSASRTAPKINFKWELPQGHDLAAEDLLIEEIDEFAMQAEYSDRSYGRSLLTWRAYEMVNIPTAQTFKIRVERNGEFQGLYSYMDTYDKTWRKRFDIQDEGSFYKAKTSAFNQARPVDVRFDLKTGTQGHAPVQAMLDVIVDGTPAEREAYVRANFDIDQMIDYAAVTALAQHIDSSSKNFYVWLPNDTGRWQIIPWDLDHTWGNDCCPVFSDFVTPAEPGDKVNMMLKALLEVDEYEAQYFVRVKELRDMILADGVLEDIFDAEIGPANQEAALDKVAWGYCCSVPFERADVFAEIQSRRDVFDNDPRVGGGDPPDPTDYVCAVETVGNDAVLTFSGPRGTSEQLRGEAGGWIARVENDDTITVVGGALDNLFVRLRGNGYSVDPPGYTQVDCDGGDPPDPDEYACTIEVDGFDAIVTFTGPRGVSEQLRGEVRGWIAQVEDQDSITITGGALNDLFVRLRGERVHRRSPRLHPGRLRVGNWSRQEVLLAGPPLELCWPQAGRNR